MKIELFVSVSNTKLNGQSGFIEVNPGNTAKGTLDYHVWNPGNCPSCIVQIVPGFGETPITCVYHGIPGFKGYSPVCSTKFAVLVTPAWMGKPALSP